LKPPPETLQVIGLGVLGKEGSGRLRIVAKEQKMKLSAKTAKKVARQNQNRAGGPVSGMTSTLAFTPVQGFELMDPTKMGGQKLPEVGERSGTESYFSSMGGFRSIRKLG
jgi:U4/U6 small nuclear ribonucleoprotein PRP31